MSSIIFLNQFAGSYPQRHAADGRGVTAGPTAIDRKLGAGRKGRIECEEEDGLGAISSDVPQRFIGIIPIIFSRIWAASSLPLNTLPTIGVSMGPGVTALTRISRGSNSAASVRANERSAALAAPYAALPGIPLTLATEVVRTIESPQFMKGTRRGGWSRSWELFVSKYRKTPWTIM
jgi:hypothetical protein